MPRVLDDILIAKRYLVFFLLLLLFTSAGYSQIKFHADCPNKIIGKNEYLEIQFTVENAEKVQEITPPSFKNFQIISGPNQQSGMSNINGSIKQYVSLGYVLAPSSPGRFVIGPASTIADGKEYYSEPVTIEVTNRSGTHPNNKSVSPFSNLTLDDLNLPRTNEYDDYLLKKGENINDKIRKNLFVIVGVSKTQCYVGEPIIATYKLYSRLKSDSRVTKTPSFNGFSVSELGNRDNYTLHTEKYKGRDYNVYLLRKVALYPLQSGRIALEPTEVENKIAFTKANAENANQGKLNNDFFRDFGETTNSKDVIEKDVVLKNDPVVINVLPLPLTNKPENFKGAIGRFKISATLGNETLGEEDADSLIVKIEGQGNIQMINAPKIEIPKGLEFFESKLGTKIENGSVPMKGSVIFTFPFSASAKGNYTIESISFSYFDDSEGVYKTIATDPITLKVHEGKGDNLYSQRVTRKLPFVISNLMVSIVVIASLAAILILIWVSNKKKRKPDNFIEDKEIVISQDSDNELFASKSYMFEAEEALQKQDPQFYFFLKKALLKYLSEKLRTPEQELTRKRIEELLDKCNVGVHAQVLLNSLLANIELCLYAPSATCDMRQDYEKTKEVMGIMDKQVC